MRQPWSFSVALVVAMGACTTPSSPAKEDSTLQPSAEQLVTPPPLQEAAPPPEQVAMPAPRPEKEVLWKWTRTEFPADETYAWVTSQDGIWFLEAVFRHKLENVRLDVDQGDFVVLGLYEPDGDIVDPPAALLSLFQDIPNIAPSSEAYIPKGGRESVEHCGFGGRGRAYVVENLNVIDESTVDVKVRAHAGCMGVSKMRFERRDGQWVMTKTFWSWVT